MENVFSRVSFRGSFRSYQQEVLDGADRYLADGRIHIVAAPGSGKTVLGLELIRRTGRPTLILSPSVTVRHQWGERFCELFLPQTPFQLAPLSGPIRMASTKPIEAFITRMFCETLHPRMKTPSPAAFRTVSSPRR